jgi:hypothetical protein
MTNDFVPYGAFRRSLSRARMQPRTKPSTIAARWLERLVVLLPTGCQRRLFPGIDCSITSGRSCRDRQVPPSRPTPRKLPRLYRRPTRRPAVSPPADTSSAPACISCSGIRAARRNPGFVSSRKMQRSLVAAPLLDGCRVFARRTFNRAVAALMARVTVVTFDCGSTSRTLKEQEQRPRAVSPHGQVTSSGNPIGTLMFAIRLVDNGRRL